MIENIPTPLVSFAGERCCWIFHGDVSKESPEIPCNNHRLLGAVFLVIQWMQARQYIQGQVDWNRAGNDTMAWFQSLSAQVSSTHILGTLGIPATSGLAIGLAAGLTKS